MNLMYYVVNKDTTLLHQINDDINKVYQKKSADFYSNKCLEIFPMLSPENKLFVQI